MFISNLADFSKQFPPASKRWKKMIADADANPNNSKNGKFMKNEIKCNKLWGLRERQHDSGHQIDIRRVLINNRSTTFRRWWSRRGKMHKFIRHKYSNHFDNRWLISSFYFIFLWNKKNKNKIIQILGHISLEWICMKIIRRDRAAYSCASLGNLYRH